MSQNKNEENVQNQNQVQVEQIDHVELVVPDRYEAAEWYKEIFGLEIPEKYRIWAESNGPLVVSSHEGGTKLALFEGSPKPSGMNSNFRRVAFRIDGKGFLELIDKLKKRDDIDVSGREEIVDHTLSYSIYFTDPWGYRYEITTPDYEFVRDKIP